MLLLSIAYLRTLRVSTCVVREDVVSDVERQSKQKADSDDDREPLYRGAGGVHLLRAAEVRFRLNRNP